MRLLLIVAVACLALGADARLSARKARQLQNYNNNGYNNGGNYAGGNYQNWVNQYKNGNGGYNNDNNGNYNQQNGQYDNNGGNYQGDEAEEYQQYNENYDGENGGQDAQEYNNNGNGNNNQQYDENGNYVQDEYYDENYDENFDYATDADDEYTDDMFTMEHYKKLLEVHDMMEFYRLMSAIFGFVIFLLALYICYLRRMITLATEQASGTPYGLAGATTPMA